MSDLLPCPLCDNEARLVHDTFSGHERQWSWGIECCNAGKCELALSGFASKEAAIVRWNTRVDTKRVLLNFYNEVCDQAERNMEKTGTVSGAHWNAMRQILGQMGIQVKH